MRGVSRKIMAGFPAIFYGRSGQKLWIKIHLIKCFKPVDELIRHFRSEGEVSCAVAEREDQILIRLADLKLDLRPEDEKAIADIDRFYRRHVLSE